MPYINDIDALKLILFGGVTGKDVADYHDWEFILRNLDWLEYDLLLAGVSCTAGIVMMLCSFLWGGALLLKQRKNLTGF